MWGGVNNKNAASYKIRMSEPLQKIDFSRNNDDRGRPRESRRKAHHYLAGTRWHNRINGSGISSLIPNSTLGFQKIGGPNTVIRIDETFIVKRKYNRGRNACDSWLIGGIDSTSKEVFVEITPIRDSVALDDKARTSRHRHLHRLL